MVLFAGQATDPPGLMTTELADLKGVFGRHLVSESVVYASGDGMAVLWEEFGVAQTLRSRGWDLWFSLTVTFTRSVPTYQDSPR